MNRLALAQARLEQLGPLSAAAAIEPHSERLENWLRDQVVPVVEDLCENPVFRRYLRAIPEQLFEQSQSPQRTQLQNFADTMVLCAQSLVEAAHQVDLSDIVSDEDRSDDEAWLAEPANQRFDRRSVVDKLAERPWFDIVNSMDFFTPSADLFLRDPDGLLTRQFRRSLRYSKALGDHVIELMFARFDFWRQRLHVAHNRLMRRSKGRETWPAVDRCFSCILEMDQQYETLRSTWLAGAEPRLRRACVTLLQTYLAYHPSPQLPWLGPCSHSLKVHGEMIHSYFRVCVKVVEVERICAHRQKVVKECMAHLVDPQLITQVAEALEDLSQIYHRGIQPGDLIDEARARYDLVVVVQPRIVFWRGELIDLNWNSAEKCWNLMLHLAVAAEGLQSLDAFDLTGVNTPRGLSVRKHKLSEFLLRSANGSELIGYIEKVRGGSLKLNLDRQKIKVLDLGANSWTVDEQEFRSTSTAAPLSRSL